MAKTSVGDVARETGTKVCWTPEGGLLLEGRIIGRTSRSVRVGEVEHTVYSYKVLAGDNIFWLEVWDGKPVVVGAPIKKEVEVRAYSGKGGVSYRLVLVKEERNEER